MDTAQQTCRHCRLPIRLSSAHGWIHDETAFRFCGYGSLRYAAPGNMPEWRRRSLEGRGRFDAVTDTTDRVVGR
jgi:hypothetical protein